MNSFDPGILHFLNQFAQRSWLIDSLISQLGDNSFLKGGVITAILWWLWFREGQTKSRDREFILGGLLTSLAALFAARTLALVLPFRERPLHIAELHFVLPYGVGKGTLIGWSSFPSDHAVLYFSLAACIFFLSRRAGILASFHALFVVCLPRIYLGFHYPTDVLAGALLGVGFAYLLKIESLRALLTRSPLQWLDRSPAWFYACFYLASFLTATNFDPLRLIAGIFWEAARATLHGRS